MDYDCPTDVQTQVDRRGIPLPRVGVTGLTYPLAIATRAGGRQLATVRIDLLVGVHAEQRGAHLSSLVQTVEACRDRVFDVDAVADLARQARRGQDELGRAAETAEARLRFTYCVPKTAPASGASALVAYACSMQASLGAHGTKGVLVSVPVTSVCPCSLEVSRLGAHNQRAEVSLQVWQSLDDPRRLWLEDLIDLVEHSGSAPVHSLLTRADEQAIIEQMVQRPRFVEDIVREVIVRLRQVLSGVRYEVRCTSYESIHAHNAYAEASGDC